MRSATVQSALRTNRSTIASNSADHQVRTQLYANTAQTMTTPPAIATSSCSAMRLYVEVPTCHGGKQERAERRSPRWPRYVVIWLLQRVLVGYPDVAGGKGCGRSAKGQECGCVYGRRDGHQWTRRRAPPSLNSRRGLPTQSECRNRRGAKERSTVRQGL